MRGNDATSRRRSAPKVFDDVTRSAAVLSVARRFEWDCARRRENAPRVHQRRHARTTQLQAIPRSSLVRDIPAEMIRLVHRTLPMLLRINRVRAMSSSRECSTAKQCRSRSPPLLDVSACSRAANPAISQPKPGSCSANATQRRSLAPGALSLCVAVSTANNAVNAAAGRPTSSRTSTWTPTSPPEVSSIAPNVECVPSRRHFPFGGCR